jgi:hypothetical protein
METQSNSQKKSQRDLEKGALWLKKSKAGADFLSGYITDENNNKVNIVVFKNGFKKPGELSPDYRVYVSENQLAASTSQPQADEQNNVKSKSQAKQPPLASVETDSDPGDDIPF